MPRAAVIASICMPAALLAPAVTLAAPRVEQPVSQAPGVERVLGLVDAVLANSGGQRIKAFTNRPCRETAKGGGPGTISPDFMCEGTTDAGRWDLARLRARGGEYITAELEIRRFISPHAAAQVKAIAAERFGGAGGAGYHDGSISWCYWDVVWTDELLISLKYWCSVSLRHVKSLAAVRNALLSIGLPENGAVGIAGSHSGWSQLISAKGEQVVVPDSQRFHHFARVTGVHPGDVLWVRGGGESQEQPKVGKLAPGATCIPLIFNLPTQKWWKIRFGEDDGWVRSSFLQLQTQAECQELP